MFHKYSSFTNTLSLSDQVSAYLPQGFGTKETTNNFFVAPQPKSHQPASSHVPSTVTSKANAHTTASVASHAHSSHRPPWEGVNLWRTPFKGDTDTITQVKNSKGTLDRYVENRTRRIQQLQLEALHKKHIPTWIMMSRDKAILVAQGAIVAYVLYQVTTTVYQHLKAKDRLKLIKLLYKDNVD